MTARGLAWGGLNHRGRGEHRGGFYGLALWLRGTGTTGGADGRSLGLGVPSAPLRVTGPLAQWLGRAGPGLVGLGGGGGRRRWVELVFLAFGSGERLRGAFRPWAQKAA